MSESNIYIAILASALILQFGLDLLASLLNMKSLKGGLPEEFSNIFSAEEYRKSQSYIRTKTKFQLMVSGINLIVIFLFWFLGCFNIIDEIVRGWNLPMILSGLLYVCILLLISVILILPFSAYETLVIEDKFGFNKSRLSTFLLDTFKTLALTVLLGGFFMALVLALFQYVGSLAWLYCWAAISFFSLVNKFIIPTFILPLFNKFRPIEEGELRESITSYADDAGFSLANIFVMDHSKRSTKSNAFFIGLGKGKRVVLFDTLISKHTIPEIVAIFAHEIGHYKKQHVFKDIIISMVRTGIAFLLFSFFVSQEGLYQAFFMDNNSIYAGFVFFGLLYLPINYFISIILKLYYRHREFEADRFACETIENPQALIDALKKMSLNNLSNLNPHPFYVFLNYSHPPLLKRINRIRTFNSREQSDTLKGALLSSQSG